MAVENYSRPQERYGTRHKGQSFAFLNKRQRRDKNWELPHLKGLRLLTPQWRGPHLLLPVFRAQRLKARGRCSLCAQENHALEVSPHRHTWQLLLPLRRAQVPLSPACLGSDSIICHLLVPFRDFFHCSLDKYPGDLCGCFYCFLALHPHPQRNNKGKRSTQAPQQMPSFILK